MKKTLHFVLIFISLFFLLNSNSFAQTGKLRGVVTDATTGDVLPGSNLIFKELSIGAAADAIPGLPAHLTWHTTTKGGERSFGTEPTMNAITRCGHVGAF